MLTQIKVVWQVLQADGPDKLATHMSEHYTNGHFPNHGIHVNQYVPYNIFVSILVDSNNVQQDPLPLPQTLFRPP